MQHPDAIYRVDLSSETIAPEDFSAEQIKAVLGGFGFNTWYLYNKLPGHVHALSPGNILIISRGLLTGTAAPASSRVHLSAKSPLSGLMGSSNVGGYIGVRLKSLHIAALVITGRAAALSYLLADENGVSIQECEYIRGMDTRQTEAALRAIHPGRHTEILCIGEAGENLVPFACVMQGSDHAAGRTGMGAVMGSKNLKAVVVAGRRQHETTGGAEKAVIREYIKKIQAGQPLYDEFSKWGSASYINSLNEEGQLGTRNYREGRMEDAHRIDGRNLTRYAAKKTGCHRCPIHCKAEIRMTAGRYKGLTGGRPEYETVINMGALCGLSDPEALIYLSNLSNILGIDTISTGSVIAFALDLFDRGILTPQDTGGLDLKWGDAVVMETLMRQIAARKGLGEILSHGVRKAAEIIGRGSQEYAYHAKGVEIYGGDPRGFAALGLTYAVSLRGGDFTSIYPVPAFRYDPARAEKDFGARAVLAPDTIEGKGALIRKCLLVCAVIDSLGICKVPALSIVTEYDLENESRLIQAISGMDLSSQALFVIGERIIAMEKLFNLAHGATVRDDTLPDLFQTQGLPRGPAKGRTVDRLFKMVQDFYECMEWDENGVPCKSLCKRLCI